MTTTVIREIADGVTIFSAPFSRMGVFPVGGRSTAIRLKNGGVWILASTPLDTETKNTLDAMGPVKYIISPDAVHHMFLTEYQRAYPEAKMIAPQEVIEKKAKEGLKFEGSWGRDSPDTRYGFEPEIEHQYFSGHVNKDVAFYHAGSKSLIVADLLFNMPPTEQYSKTRVPLPRYSLGMNPFTSLHRYFVWGTGIMNNDAMRRDAKVVAQWDFDRIIPCHGDVIEKVGKKAWESAYACFLN